MKSKRAFLVVSITALIVAIILISLRAYYVAIALVMGALLLGHREFWSLIRKRKLPPIDERVRENTNKSIRNGFIFLIIALAFLMLPFSVRIIETPNTVHVLGGLFVSGGAVYLFSYLFYDRVKPKLDEGRLRMLRIFLLVAGISLGAFIISVFLHNALSGLFDIEEPVFFVIAVFISPLAFAVGLIGSLVMFIKGLFSKAL
ncbi:hypothetical protein ES703_74389 [subsurface metagenome]|jgi:hypothetical protein|uniref:Uncharacterized protein n=2 Tax=marine sediment metagenome TaxID=412755 RepID=X1TXJ0_9ZZZZ